MILRPAGAERRWRHTERPNLPPFINALSRQVATMEALGQWRLPDVRRGATLHVVSDYAGQDPRLAFNVMAFLLLDDASLGPWRQAVRELRARYLPHDERLSFKGLRHANKERAFGPFVRATNRIDGALVLIAIHKGVSSLFLPALKHHDMSAPHLAAFSVWDGRTFERVLRVIHFASMFIAALCAPRQTVTWVTDDDDMVANASRMNRFLWLWANILQHSVDIPLGQLRLTTPSIADKPLLIEDALAVPDLAAAALAEVLTDADRAGSTPTSTDLFAALPSSPKPKVEAIADWLADNDQPLRRMILAIYPRDVPWRSEPRWLRLHRSTQLGVPPVIVSRW